MSARECPFCGGADIKHVLDIHKGTSISYLECCRCDARGPRNTADYGTVENDLAAWNRRAPDPRVAKLREAAEAARARFVEYAGHHAAKPDPEKAARNRDMAERLFIALAALQEEPE